MKEIEEFLELKYDIARLDLTEKIVSLFSVFYSVLVFMILVPGIFMFLSFALSYYLGNILGANHWGFLLVSVFYLVLTIVLIIFRKKMLTKPLVKFLTNLILKS